MKKLLLLFSCGGPSSHSGFAVLAAEAFNPACRIHQLLLASEKGMAIGADFHVYVATMGGTRGEGISAGAVNAHFVIGRMNGCFHKSPVVMQDYLILWDRRGIQQTPANGDYWHLTPWGGESDVSTLGLG